MRLFLGPMGTIGQLKTTVQRVSQTFSFSIPNNDVAQIMFADSVTTTKSTLRIITLTYAARSSVHCNYSSNNTTVYNK